MYKPSNYNGYIVCAAELDSYITQLLGSFRRREAQRKSFSKNINTYTKRVNKHETKMHPKLQKSPIQPTNQPNNQSKPNEPYFLYRLRGRHDIPEPVRGQHQELVLRGDGVHAALWVGDQQVRLERLRVVVGPGEEGVHGGSGHEALVVRVAWRSGAE
jgi:hypothetical protein